MDRYQFRLEEMYGNEPWLNDFFWATDNDYHVRLGAAFEHLNYGNQEAALTILKNMKAEFDQYVKPEIERDIERNRSEE